MTRDDQPAREIILPPTAEMGENSNHKCLKTLDKKDGNMTLPDFSLQLPKKDSILVLAYASTVSEAERQQCLEKLTYTPEMIDAGKSHLLTLNYQVDHTLREACLADPHQWREESGTLVFISTNKLKVYLGTPDHPLGIDQAYERICELGMSTIITARIVLGLWNTRKANKLLLTENGDTVIRLEDIFEWRGLKKSSHKEPGSGKRSSQGYRSADRKEVLKDLDLLASCCIKGRVTCISEGKRVQEPMDSSYLHYSIIRREAYRPEGITAGVVVRPGNWLEPYEKYDNYFVAQTDRKIFHFHPLTQQHELKLALFLTEKWRQQKQHNRGEPIMMAHLLALSGIRIDKNNLTSRFIPHIQEALETLWKQEIIGSAPQCIHPADMTQPHWGKAWLASQWIIDPPQSTAAQPNHKVGKPTKSGSGGGNFSGVKAIETVYSGHKFRSRIEARYAIFFETLDIEYRYEMEGYDFDGIRYLPDFWLPEYNCWIEIKGQAPTEDELMKAHLLSLYRKKPVYLFFGDIWPLSQEKYGGAYYCSETGWKQGYFWYECLNCGMIGLASAKDTGRFLCQCINTSVTRYNYSDTSSRLLNAYKTARQARFEFGEQRGNLF